MFGLLVLAQRLRGSGPAPSSAARQHGVARARRPRGGRHRELGLLARTRSSRCRRLARAPPSRSGRSRRRARTGRRPRSPRSSGPRAARVSCADPDHLGVVARGRSPSGRGARACPWSPAGRSSPSVSRIGAPIAPAGEHRRRDPALPVVLVHEHDRGRAGWRRRWPGRPRSPLRRRPRSGRRRPPGRCWAWRVMGKPSLTAASSSADCRAELRRAARPRRPRRSRASGERRRPGAAARKARATAAATIAGRVPGGARRRVSLPAG